MQRHLIASSRFLLCAALLAGTFPARAQVDCVGAITSLSLQLGLTGTVTLSLSNGPNFTYLCNIDSVALNGVSPTICRAMYASLLTAKSTGKRVLIRFNDYASCGAVPSWAAAGSLGWTQMLLD